MAPLHVYQKTRLLSRDNYGAGTSAGGNLWGCRWRSEQRLPTNVAFVSLKQKDTIVLEEFIINRVENSLVLV